jgi:hypothetical protein
MRQMTRDETRDTGMAMVLLALILWLAFRHDGLVRAAIALLVLTMTVPRVLAPVAVAWFTLSHAIGTVMSTLLFTLTFAIVITPIGVVRRLLGKDPLQLRGFKASRESVMVRRNHLYAAGDLEKPY